MTEQLVFMNGQPTQSLQVSHSSGKVAYWVGAQYATGDQWRNNSRKNAGTERKQKQHQYNTVISLQLIKINGKKKRLPGAISITSDMQMIPPLWQKVKKN